MENLREQKAKLIAKTRIIKRLDDGFAVQSQHSKRFYFVDEKGECTCPDCTLNGTHPCKHVLAVKYYLTIEKTNKEGIKTTEKVRLTYPQAWQAYNQAQTSELQEFDRLLKDLLENIEEPSYEFGRPSLSLKESLFCSIKKVYSQMSSRRAKGLFNQALEKEIIKKSPHFNAVSKQLNKQETTAILEKLISLSALPLKNIETTFAIDSTGFRTTRFNDYCIIIPPIAPNTTLCQNLIL